MFDAFLDVMFSAVLWAVFFIMLFCVGAMFFGYHDPIIIPIGGTIGSLFGVWLARDEVKKLIKDND